jgi:hypothetical protein
MLLSGVGQTVDLSGSSDRSVGAPVYSAVTDHVKFLQRTVDGGKLSVLYFD